MEQLSAFYSWDIDKLSSTFNSAICLLDLAFIYKHCFLVLQHEEIGHVVVQVLATDGDTGLNGVVQFEFVQAGSSDHKYFSIENKTGIIRVAQDIDREKQVYYNVSRCHDAFNRKRRNKIVGLDIEMVK